MRKIYIFSFLLLFVFAKTHAQQSTIYGQLADSSGNNLGFATVVLLNPGDSTMAFFGITNTEGQFQIKNVTPGKYLMQAAYLGCITLYRKLDVPLKNGGDLGRIIMRSNKYSLKEVQVVGEKIPIMIKRDTIEYNAGAFKTKPDANVEELIKKLPGMEVDRAGNIKAQGEGVKKVLVDGKEFFGNDPKVATKNIPADAIKKVQVYNKRSDQADFTGIDDGERDKTINLQLKDDKKVGYFGDVQGGYGTDEHYQGSAKVYNFKPKTQFAALGMMNNINQFGFSLQDYINFKGGIRGLMDGSGSAQMTLTSNSTLPVDFGQPVTGLTTSGAGGLNFTWEPSKKNRFNISYLGNGANKNLVEQTNSTNFTPQGEYKGEQGNTNDSRDRANRGNLSWKVALDSTQQLIVNGDAELSTSRTTGQLNSRAYAASGTGNYQSRSSLDNASGLIVNSRASYVKKSKTSWPLFKISADFNTNQSITNTSVTNIASYLEANQTDIYSQFQKDNASTLKYNGQTSIVRNLGHDFYAEFELAAGINRATLNRSQGPLPSSDANEVDSISPNFSRQYQYYRPGIGLKRNVKDSKLNFWFRLEQAQMISGLIGTAMSQRNFTYFTPRLSWERDFTTSKRLTFMYDAKTNAPSAMQLLPVANAFNKQQIIVGNAELRPEYAHTLSANAVWFDQFSFTSMFFNVSGSYIHDKINFSREVDANLTQKLTYMNTPDYYQAQGRAEYSTPIRKLGLTVSASFNEQVSKGSSMINKVENKNTTLSHEFELSFNNRKKDKVDVRVGAAVTITDAKYSIERALNNTYYNFGYFTDVTFTPNEHWNFTFSADVNRYTGRSFAQNIDIPLLKAQVSYYCLKANRGVFTLDVFDILNKNTGLQRNSELNYLLEKRSNVIGTYVMLSFKYRLNKLGGNNGGMQIKVNKR